MCANQSYSNCRDSLHVQRPKVHLHYRHHNSTSQCLLNTYYVIVPRVLHISAHVITRTSNSEITYIYTSPLIHSTLLRLWKTAIVERMGKKKKKELDSNSVSDPYRLQP